MRIANFNAGPAVMPRSVLETIQNDLLDYRGMGLSVLEMSHRSAAFADIAHQAEQDLRDLLMLPDHFHVLFLQGGASAQFALSVKNLDCTGAVAFANTGYWSAKAMAAAASLTEVIESCAEASCTESLCTIPAVEQWSIPSRCSYLHTTDNETISGIAFDEPPIVNLPLVCDMSSSILSRPIDSDRYAMIYAGAQKNIGPAGLTLLIVSEDMLERSAKADLPAIFRYADIQRHSSMLNTPPTFAWYCAGLVFRWLKQQGGIDAMAQRNLVQANRVYAAIDQHACYTNRVDPRYRSRMNITFQLADAHQTSRFLAGAEAAQLVGLKGHQSVGGLRASLYNAISDEAVDDLVDYLHHFGRAMS